MVKDDYGKKTIVTYGISGLDPSSYAESQSSRKLQYIKTINEGLSFWKIAEHSDVFIPINPSTWSPSTIHHV